PIRPLYPYSTLIIYLKSKKSKTDSFSKWSQHFYDTTNILMNINSEKLHLNFRVLFLNGMSQCSYVNTDTFNVVCISEISFLYFFSLYFTLKRVTAVTACLPSNCIILNLSYPRFLTIKQR